MLKNSSSTISTIFKHYIQSRSLGAILIRASIGSAGLRLISLFFSFFIGVLLARHLGPTGYGVYALAMSITALLTVPTEFGLPSLITREVAAAKAKKDWGRIRGVLRWANTVVAVLSLTVLGVVAIWFLFRENSEDQLFINTFLWSLLLIPVVALSNLRGATLRGLGQIVRGQLPELVLRPGVFLLLLSTVGITNLSLSADYAMILQVIATSISFLIGIVMLFSAIPSQSRGAVYIIEQTRWIKSAFPMALTEGMRYLQGHMFILMLGWFLTQYDVGLYYVAYQVGLMVALPISILNIVVAPFISRFHTELDQFNVKKIVAYSAAGMFLGALSIFLVFIFFGQYLLGLFFGAEYKSAFSALLIVSGGQLVSSFFGPTATLLNMTHSERIVTHSFLIAVICSASFGFGLIPLYGIVGAAVASTIGLLIWNILMWRYAYYTLEINTSIISISRFIRSHP